MGFQRVLGVTLAVGSLLAGLLCLPLHHLVGLDTVKEILAALAVFDVLDADRDALGEDATLHSLVHDDTDGVLCHVEHTASLSVVGLVWHSLLEGAVAL